MSKNVWSVLKDAFTEQELAEMACQLNSFETPRKLGLKEKLSHKEIAGVYTLFSSFVPRKEFLKVWNSNSWKNPEDVL